MPSRWPPGNRDRPAPCARASARGSARSAFVRPDASAVPAPRRRANAARFSKKIPPKGSSSACDGWHRTCFGALSNDDEGRFGFWRAWRAQAHLAADAALGSLSPRGVRERLGPGGLYDRGLDGGQLALGGFLRAALGPKYSSRRRCLGAVLSALVLDQRRAHGAVLLRHWIGNQAGGAGVNEQARPRDKLLALQVLA